MTAPFEPSRSVRPRGRSAEIEEMLTIAPLLAVLIIAGIACLESEEHGLDVDLHHPTVLLGLLVHHGAAAADADIVVEEVEPAATVDRRVDQPLQSASSVASQASATACRPRP